jgi:predicted Rossmann fold flavoprotein
MHTYDTIVIGAGPAGLLAAGQAALTGGETLLLEKMDRPGRKLRITGKGRCNLTNVATLEEFIDHFGANGRFLRQAFHRFFTGDLIQFLGELGIRTVTERGGRVFPASNQAQEIVDVLVSWVSRSGVKVMTHSRVERVLMESKRVTGVETSAAKKDKISDKRAYEADTVVIATGGASYPTTGSTGDGYRMARAAGHTIAQILPALVPLETAGDIASRLQGLSLRNVSAALWIDGRKQVEQFGEMLFTHFGVSGPIVLSMSKHAVSAQLQGRDVTLSVDLKPALDEQKLDNRLLRDLDAHGKRQFRTLLKELLPQKLIPVCIDLTGISATKPAHQITAEERERLRIWLKDFQLKVSDHRSFNEAIVTAGGVDTREVDPRTMGSRLVEGLYFAGEVLDIDADTGGYNLQAAFSTGWLAGRSAAELALDLRR